MITPQRLTKYKEQAIASIASRANNPAAPGISSVTVTPHDLLELIRAFEDGLEMKQEEVE